MGMKILIVDDEIAVREAIELLLDGSICGIDEFFHACNGQKALELLEREKPDIMFCDMQMPLMSGDELMHEMIKRNIKTQIIAVSGYSDFQYVRATMQASGIDYILKPVDSEELNCAYQKAVDQIEELCRQKQDALEAGRARYMDACREATRWLDGSQKYGKRTEEALAVLGFGESGIRAAVLLFKNSSDIIDHMFDGNNIAFYEELNNLARKYAGEPAVLFSVDEYLYILLFTNANIQDAGFFLHKYTVQAQEKIGLSMIFEYSPDAVSCTRLLKSLERLKSRLLLRHPTPAGMEGQNADSANFKDAKQLEPVLRHLVQENNIDRIGKTLTAFSEQIFLPGGAFLKDIQLTTSELNGILLRMSHEKEKTVSPVSLWLFHQRQWAEEFKDRFYALVDYTGTERVGMEAVYQYLVEHYSENVTIGVLTEYFYLSPQYISKRFKERYGITIVTALTAIRMEQARLFLEHTNLTVGQIAERTGYVDEGYFSKVFKKETGMSPMGYRKTYM